MSAVRESGEEESTTEDLPSTASGFFAVTTNGNSGNGSDTGSSRLPKEDLRDEGDVMGNCRQQADGKASKAEGRPGSAGEPAVSLCPSSSVSVNHKSNRLIVVKDLHVTKTMEPSAESREDWMEESDDAISDTDGGSGDISRGALATERIMDAKLRVENPKDARSGIPDKPSLRRRKLPGRPLSAPLMIGKTTVTTDSAVTAFKARARRMAQGSPAEKASTLPMEEARDNGMPHDRTTEPLDSASNRSSRESSPIPPVMRAASEEVTSATRVSYAWPGLRPKGDLGVRLPARTRRSLSVGGAAFARNTGSGKEAGEGWVSDGDEEALSAIGQRIAYIKQRRGSRNSAKSDRSSGGLGLAAWPHKAKKDVDSAKVIYLGDIDFDAPGEATATDILVRQHRTRVRVKRVKNKGHATKKRKPKTRRRRIRNGKPLHPEEDEVEYILTIGMMLGLRVAVGRQANPLAKPELTVEDFYQVDKYTFPPSGATGYLITPSHKLGRTFKFKDYAPKVFKKIREHFGVDKMRYMLSVAGNYNFLEFISNAKSGEFFFFSHDERFMIKTMKSSETKFLRRILPHYYEHVKVHPETFLVRFYGMYRVKMHHINRKVHFIVMNSVLDTDKEIHNTYDLKGSSLGRSAKEGEKVLKDNDLAEKQGKVHLGSHREAFLKVVRADSEFLARMKIMDYSLLTGIHDRAAPAEVEQQQSPRRYSKFFTFADEAENKATPGFKQVSGVREGDAKARDPVDGVAENGMEPAVLSTVEPAYAPSALQAASKAGEGIRMKIGKRDNVAVVPSSTLSVSTFDSAQAELMFDDQSSHAEARKHGSDVLESVAEAAAAGELYAVSGDEDGDAHGDGDGETIDLYSDEDPSGTGGWSGGGTGTEGECEEVTEGEDTGGDFMEGDIEVETHVVGMGEEQQAKSLSRCSTAKGNVSQFAGQSHDKGHVGTTHGGDARRGVQRRLQRQGDRGRRPEPRLAPPETAGSCAIRRRSDGGLESEVNGKRGQDIYYMGIIDILQEYNARKHGETFFKSIAHDRAEISCVDPQSYCQRFNDFLERHTD